MNITEDLLERIHLALVRGATELTQMYAKEGTNTTLVIPDNSLWYSIKNTGPDDITVDLGTGGTFTMTTGEAYTSDEQIKGFAETSVIAITSAASAAKVVYKLR